MKRAGQIALGLLGALAIVFLFLLGFGVFGEGPVVLVLHGMMGGYDQGLLIAKAVGKADFQFIAVSRPGYLRTPLRSGQSFEEQADGYVALLDALRIEKAGVIAYSAGGH